MSVTPMGRLANTAEARDTAVEILSDAVMDRIVSTAEARVAAVESTFDVDSRSAFSWRLRA